MKTLLFLFFLLAPQLSAQMDYAVSSGSQAFVPLAAVPPAQQIDMMTTPVSGLIAPAGFSFTYDGVTYTDFLVHRSGVVTMGYVGLFGGWTSDASQERMIAPFFHSLAYVAGSSVSWDFQAGVLTVEWLNLEDWGAQYGYLPTTYSFQLVMDTGSGAIEFRYGQRVGTPYTISSGRYSASLTGSSRADGKVVVPAGLAGFIDVDGKLIDWPADSYVQFAPTGSGRSVPEVQVSVGGTTMNYEDMYQAALGQSVSSLNIQVDVADADGDPAWVEAAVYNCAVDPAELSSSTAAVPYTLLPTTGNLTNTGTQTIELVIGDGFDVRRIFVFALKTPVPAGGGGGGGKGGTKVADPVTQILGAALKSGAVCSTNPDAEGATRVALLFAILLVARRVSRRRAA